MAAFKDKSNPGCRGFGAPQRRGRLQAARAVSLCRSSPPASFGPSPVLVARTLDAPRGRDRAHIIAVPSFSSRSVSCPSADPRPRSSSHCSCPTVAAAENWPQWRGPGGQGISTERDADRMGARAQRRWKIRCARAFVADRLGRPSLPDRRDRRRGPARAEGRRAHDGRQALGPSRQRRGRAQAHAEGAGARREDRQDRLGADRVRRPGVRRAAPPQQLRRPDRATDGKMVFAYFGPEGLYAYDINGKLAWKVVEKFPTLGLGTGTSPVLYQNLVIIQRDEDNGDVGVVAYDKDTGKEAWRAKRHVQISWATPVLVDTGRRDRARHQRHRVHHRLRPGDRQGAVADEGRREQRHPHAARRPRPGHRHRRLSREEGHRDPPGRRCPRQARRVGVREGHRLRALEHPLRRLRLPAHRQRHRHLPRRDNRRGEVRGGRVPVPARFMGSPVAFGGMSR